MPHNKNINLIIVNGRPATTSRKIAKYFNKQHKDVLRKIENLDCSPQFTERNFAPSDYKDSSGKTCKEYIVYRDGFTFLTMGFTGKFATQFKEDYIYAFNEMERRLRQPQQTAPQQAYMTVNDVLKLGGTLEETTIKILHTRQGEIINVTQLEQQPTPEVINNIPTMPNKPLWIQIIEAFFDEIDNEGIPEKMRQNMLLAKESIVLSTGKNERHLCLFFRASNMIAFFHESPRFFDLLNASSIHSAQTLVKQLQQAGILAFTGKTKEKGIPINPSIPSDVRRVPHLVALDLVVLEQDYGVVISSSGGIAKTLR